MTSISFDTFKDLAGPVATIVASVAAGFVTWRIQKENHRTKRDELRMALFSRRYEIYAATVEYVGFMLSRNKHDPMKELPLSQQFGRLVLESRFTCSTRVQRHLEDIKEAAFEYAFEGAEIEDIGENPEEMKCGYQKVASGEATT